MDLGDQLTETVQFELPDLAGAARLAALLRPAWTVAVIEREEVAVVAVFFRAAATDLAGLMRSVENWVAREALRAIRFELDGRSYVMEAGEADWSVVPTSAAA
jgi:hypothetical protein